MGSSTSRKANDQVRINRPIAGAGTGVGGGTTPPPDTNILCPVTFRVKLSNQDTPVGTKLLITDGNSMRIASSPDVEVGRLSADIVNRISKCSELGFDYSAEVVDHKGVRYARFSQR